MRKDWPRLAALTGIPFAVLFFVGALVGGNTPSSDASPQHVVTFYATHRDGQHASAFLIAYGVVFGLFFAAALRSYLRARSDGDALVMLGFAGMVVLAVGAATLAGISFAAADVPTKIAPTAMQALNVLQNDLFFALLIGVGVFLIGNGLAVAFSAALPRWLGWVAVPLGVLGVTPVGWFVLIFVLPIWTLIVSVLMFLRRAAPEALPTPAVQPG